MKSSGVYRFLGLVSFAVVATPAFVATVPFTTAGSAPFDRSAWEAAVTGTITTDTFSNDISNADSIVFDSGVQSDAANPQGSPVNNLVDSTLGTSGRIRRSCAPPRPPTAAT